MDTEDFLQPGTTVDRYTVEKPLGQGGMAVVYQVRHNQLGTLHAMKMLMMPVRSVRQRLLQEGRVQAALRHPNIVAVTDVIDFEDAPGLVMEFVAGPSLDQLLEKHKLTYEQADIIAAGIIQGVAAAHAQGLIHRDLKPANVLLEVTKAGLVPKVADFGLAKVLEGPSGHTQTRSGVTMGTPAYMAPEQIRDAKNVDERADIFSLGCILYDLACGDRAFQGSDTFELFSAVTSGRYQAPRELAPDMPARFENAIVGALQTDPSKRIPDCATLLEVWLGKRAFDASAENEGKAQKVWGEVLESASSFAPDTDSAPAISAASSEPNTYYVPTGAQPAIDLSSPASAATVAGTAAPFDLDAFDDLVSPAGGSLVPHGPGDSDFHERPTTVEPPSQASLLSVNQTRTLLYGAPIIIVLLGVFVLGLVGVGLVIGTSMLSGPQQTVETVPTAEAPITIEDDLPAPPAPSSTKATVEPLKVTPSTPPAPAEASPTKAPQTRPTSKPVVKPEPEPSGTSGTINISVKTEPEPPPAPIVRVREKPTPPVEEAPPPAPVGPPPGMGRINKEGDGTLYLWIRQEWVQAGDHPPGTYNMKIMFVPTNPIPTGSVEVKAGHITTVRCPKALSMCTQRGEPALP